MTRVTIYQGGLPQFFGTFARKHEADDYRAMWRKLAVSAGIFIRMETTHD